METGDKFIQINNDIFDKNEQNITIFYQIGTEGFTIFCFLLFMKKNSSCAVVSIKMIQKFLNRDVTKKRKVTEGLSDKRTILKYLLALQRVGLIENVDKPIDNTFKLNDMMILVFHYEVSKSWSGINEKLLIDYVHKLGHIGWSVYCLLFRLHNMGFGGQAGNYGFANPSENYMSLILNRHENTIKKYLIILEKYNLIKIIPQDPIPYKNANGETEYQYTPNHYIVKAKAYPDNKYFINFYK